MRLLRLVAACGALLAPLTSAEPPPGASAANRPRPVLGLTLADQPEPLGAAPGLPVQRVAGGSAAEAMGVRVGDRVLEANGRPVANAADLGRALEALPAGGELRLAVMRDGERVELAVALLPAPTPQDLAALEQRLLARAARIAAAPRDERSQVQRLLAALAALEAGLAPARAGFARSYPEGELTLQVGIELRSDAVAEGAHELVVHAPLAPAAPVAPAAEPPRAGAAAP